MKNDKANISFFTNPQERTLIRIYNITANFKTQIKAKKSNFMLPKDKIMKEIKNRLSNYQIIVLIVRDSVR